MQDFETKTDADVERMKTLLNADRLRLERSKLAIETRLRRRELSGHAQKAGNALFANPLILAIIGGSLTLLTSVVTNGFATYGNQQADLRRQEANERSASLALQADLVKTFLTNVDTAKAKDNLLFLVESGLIPDYQDSIKRFREANPDAKPGLSSGSATLRAAPPQCPPLDFGPDRGPGASRNISIHLGNNYLDPTSYGGWSGDLRGCVADSLAMQEIAAGNGFTTNVLVDATSRWDFLSQYLDVLATSLRSGDTLLITRSGTGGSMPDSSGKSLDGIEET
jgi:hypothetical protein